MVLIVAPTRATLRFMLRLVPQEVSGGQPDVAEAFGAAKARRVPATASTTSRQRLRDCRRGAGTAGKVGRGGFGSRGMFLRQDYECCVIYEQCLGSRNCPCRHNILGVSRHGGQLPNSFIRTSEVWMAVPRRIKTPLGTGSLAPFQVLS